MTKASDFLIKAITLTFKARSALTTSALAIPTAALFGGLNAWPDDADDAEDRQA